MSMIFKNEVLHPCPLKGVIDQVSPDCKHVHMGGDLEGTYIAKHSLSIKGANFFFYTELILFVYITEEKLSSALTCKSYCNYIQVRPELLCFFFQEVSVYSK